MSQHYKELALGYPLRSPVILIEMFQADNEDVRQDRNTSIFEVEL